MALLTPPFACRPAAGDAWSARGPFGGDVRALVLDPAAPATVYAGTNGGGVFRSADRGLTWTAATSAKSPQPPFLKGGLRAASLRFPRWMKGG